MRRLLAILILLPLSAPVAAQWLGLATPGIPRTPDGKPDLSAPAPRWPDGRPDLTGLWARRGLTGDLFELSKAHDWARELQEARERSFFSDRPSHQCLPRGPGNLTAGEMQRIVQNPTVIVVLHDDLTYRQIFMDGRALEAQPNPSWMGYSVGRWDGDTLVVESNGFNDKTWLTNNGLSHTESLRITERYRRVDFGHVQVEVAYEDSGTFASPVNARFMLELVADDELLETVCNESSEGRKHWVGAISDAEATIVAVEPEILAKYVGTYRGYWVRNLTTVEVSLESGVLSVLRNGRDRFELLPQSENTFACSCGLGYIFIRENEGPATGVTEVHVSGTWDFDRVQ